MFECESGGRIANVIGIPVLMCLQCASKGKTCVYTQSKRGGSRIRRKRVPPTESEIQTDNSQLNGCSLSILPESNQGTAMLSQLCK